MIKLTKDIFKGGFLSTKFQLSLLYNVPKIIIKNLKSNEKSIKKTMNEINSFIDNKQKDIEKETSLKIEIITSEKSNESKAKSANPHKPAILLN